MNAPHTPVVARSQPEVLRCPACDQLIARRYGSVVVPIGATVKRDKDGRVRLACPSCGARVTVTERDEAA